MITDLYKAERRMCLRTRQEPRLKVHILMRVVYLQLLRRATRFPKILHPIVTLGVNGYGIAQYTRRK